MLSREKQKEILLQLRKFYPGHATFRAENNEELQQIAINLKYLEEHGLCVSGVNVGLHGHIMLSASSITAAGLDFLEDDGGLSAILGVVTVKLHADTIRDLIAAKIEAADLPPEEKSALRKRLVALPEAALTEAIKNLVRVGLDHLPDGVHWLIRMLGG
jgi:hypothetical protein